MVVLISFEKFTAEFSASAPVVVYKYPRPMGPEIVCTTGAGEGVEVSVANVPSSSGGVYNPVSDLRDPCRNRGI